LTVYNKVSEQRFDEKQYQQAAGEVQNSRQASGQRHTDENVNTVESLLLNQEDKPQSHRTVREISREARGSIDHLFRRLFTKFKCYKKRRT